MKLAVPLLLISASIVLLSCSANSDPDTNNTGASDPVDNGAKPPALLPKQNDANRFLQFLNQSAPRNNESKSDGEAYYSAVDPNNQRLTLTAFKNFTQLNDNEVAVYINDADLGFGRRMYVNVDKKLNGRTNSVSSCVENYAPLVDGVADVDAANDIKLKLAIAANPADIIATVCMEYSGTPGSNNTIDTLTGRKFVKFFSYAADGTRIAQADLDERGLKTAPGLCNSCHGGSGNSLVNGVYQYNGDTGAQFLPWDLSTFKYSTQVGYTQADQEPLFKKFNQAILATYPQAQSFSNQQAVAIVDDQSGVVVAESKIIVTGVDDPMISFSLSVDGYKVGTPGGVTLPDLKMISVWLLPPAGLGPQQFSSFALTSDIFGNLGTDVVVTGFKNLFFSQEAGTSYPNIDNAGFMNGSVLATGDNLINDTECRTGFVIKTVKKDFACANANGTWTLQIQDRRASPKPSGQLTAWSIHFNGIPNGGYTPAAVEVVRGWYGGVDSNNQLMNPNFNEKFIPAGWRASNNANAVADPERLYLDVIGPTCRACHAQRGTWANNDLDFSSYQKFMRYAKSIKSLVFDKGLMPLARRTYENQFWYSGSLLPGILAQHMPGYVAGQEILTPGRNIANAGISRTGNLAVRTGETVRLNGNASIFTKGFDWTVTAPDGVRVTLTIDPKQAANPSFVANQVGLYQVQLDTSGGVIAAVNDQPIARTSIEVSDTAPAAISFRKNIILIGTAKPFVSSMNNCKGSRCHGGGMYTSVRTNGRLSFITYSENGDTIALQQEDYRILRDRINTNIPLDSLTIQKGLDKITHGSKGVTTKYPWFTWVDTGSSDNRKSYDIFLRWVIEGAKNN